jgi:hypothetical protein
MDSSRLPQVAIWTSALDQFSAELKTLTSGLDQLAAELEARFNRLGVGFADLADRLEAGLAVWRDLLAVMAPRGWLIPFDYNMRDAADMLHTYSERGPEAVEARMIEDFRELSATGAMTKLAHNPVLADWLLVLTMAASAHDRGEWPLAIPVWLMATEGMVRQYGIGIDDPYSIQAPASQRARRVRDLLAPSGSIAPPAAEALLTVFAGLSRSSSDPAVFSRHTVLHGRRPDIGSERDSIQCFFVLDVLVSLLEGGQRRTERAS